jgi:hypothetical protein
MAKGAAAATAGRSRRPHQRPIATLGQRGAYCVGYSTVPLALSCCNSNSWTGAMAWAALKSRSSRFMKLWEGGGGRRLAVGGWRLSVLAECRGTGGGWRRLRATGPPLGGWADGLGGTGPAPTRAAVIVFIILFYFFVPAHNTGVRSHKGTLGLSQPHLGRRPALSTADDAHSLELHRSVKPERWAAGVESG